MIVKVLVVGYGSIGKRHIANLSQHDDVDIAVCTKRQRDGFLRDRGCEVWGRLDSAILQKPDAAIVCNETSKHARTSAALAGRGIDIFVEKPLSHNRLGLGSLIQTTNRRGIITHVGCPMRFHPCMEKTKEILDGEEAGRPVVVTAENCTHMPSWHPGEDYTRGYAARKDLGGGALLTCIHEVDYLCYLFGEVQTVKSITGKYSDLEMDADDTSLILARFKSGACAQISLNMFQKPPSRYCRIVGTHGVIHCDFTEPSVSFYDPGKARWESRLAIKDYDINHMYQMELRHFLECVRLRKDAVNGLEEADATMRVVMAARRSSREGGV